jgi:K(+)-stimulated pyrophosphate-energized sodium pump
MLGGLLAGVTVTGVLMAIFQSNAGGAWDNAKKMVEDGIEVDGVKYGKGSEVHKAAVVGDTVGDPFKDTSGPSLNILLKLMSVVALVIAPSIALDLPEANAAADAQIGNEISIEQEMIIVEENDSTAIIETTTTTTVTDTEGYEETTKEVVVEEKDLDAEIEKTIEAENK